MKLVVGLGNIGGKYEDVRHNIGFLLVEKLAEKLGGGWVTDKKYQAFTAKYGSAILFAKPTTMMNNSGVAVQKLVSFYHIKTSDLWIIHDDLDIKLAQYKIQFGVGPKDHNGLNSIYEKLGTKDFWHVRVGVDSREAENRTPGDVYVLEEFLDDEKKIINDVCSSIVKELSAKMFK